MDNIRGGIRCPDVNIDPDDVQGTLVGALPPENETAGVAIDVLLESHSNKPPRLMCCTTTLLPRTSAWRRMSMIMRVTRVAQLTSYILNNPELTLPQLGTPNAIECN